MSRRLLLGHERTRIRAALAPCLAAACGDAAILARLIGVRKHTARALIERWIRGGACVVAGIARATNQSSAST